MQTKRKLSRIYKISWRVVNNVQLMKIAPKNYHTLLNTIILTITKRNGNRIANIVAKVPTIQAVVTNDIVAEYASDPFTNNAFYPEDSVATNCH